MKSRMSCVLCRKHQTTPTIIQCQNLNVYVTCALFVPQRTECGARWKYFVIHNKVDVSQGGKLLFIVNVENVF